MARYLFPGAALVMLAACQPSVPNGGLSEPTSPGANARRDAALAGAPLATLPAASPVTSAPLGSSFDDPAARPLPASVTAAVNGTAVPAQPQAAAPVQTVPSQPPAEAVNETGISAEQDFEAVSATRTIQSDAQRIAANRAQYTLVQPTELPTRPGTDQPNIVEYALRTNHPVGAQLYRRSGLRSAQRQASVCASYQSPDQAQIEFLELGGPEQDRRGLDPDGDGFACSWDPTPFRKARGGATDPATDTSRPDIVEPMAISTE